MSERSVHGRLVALVVALVSLLAADSAQAVCSAAVSIPRPLVEGDTGTTPGEATITRTGGDADGCVVGYQVFPGGFPGAAATEGLDYVATSGTVAFVGDPGGPGAVNAHTIEIPVIGDTIDEPAEYLRMTIRDAGSGTTATSIAVGTSTGFIVDDDPTPAEVQVASTTQTVGEGDGDVDVPIMLSPAPESAATVSYAIAPAATAGASIPQDASIAGTATGTVTVPGGATTASLPVSVVDDALDEADERFVLTITAVSSPNTVGSQAATEVTITDDDQPTVSVDATSLRVDESAGTASFGVSVDQLPAVGAVSVDYATARGTASVSDYTATSGTLTFTGSGSRTRTVTVPITDDALDEPDETFTLTLSGVVGATLGTATTTATITDDDVPTATVGAVTAPVAESAGSVEVTVALDQAPVEQATVPVVLGAVGDSATAPGDYTVPTGLDLVFTPGQQQRTITIPIVDDTADEVDETFTVALGVPTKAVAGTPSQTTVTIDDDDNTDLVVTLGDVSAVEGTAADGPRLVDVPVRVNQPAANINDPVVVSYATADGTATLADDDYRGPRGTTVELQPADFADPDAPPTIPVTIIGDDADEPTETFTLGITAIRGATAGGAATVTIVADERSIAVSPLRRDLATTAIGARSAPLPVTVTNDGIAPVRVGTPLNVAGADADQFAVDAADCDRALATVDDVSTDITENACVILVRLAPTGTPGARTAMLPIPSTSEAPAPEVTLTGTAVAPEPPAPAPDPAPPAPDPVPSVPPAPPAGQSTPGTPDVAAPTRLAPRIVGRAVRVAADGAVTVPCRLVSVGSATRVRLTITRTVRTARGARVVPLRFVGDGTAPLTGDTATIRLQLTPADRRRVARALPRGLQVRVTVHALDARGRVVAFSSRYSRLRSPRTT